MPLPRDVRRWLAVHLAQRSSWKGSGTCTGSRCGWLGNHSGVGRTCPRSPTQEFLCMDHTWHCVWMGLGGGGATRIPYEVGAVQCHCSAASGLSEVVLTRVCLTPALVSLPIPLAPCPVPNTHPTDSTTKRANCFQHSGCAALALLTVTHPIP